MVGGLGSSEGAPPGPRALLALFAVTAGVIVIWALHNALLLPWETAHIPDAVRDPLLLGARGVVWILPALLYLSRFDPRPRLVALGVTSRIDLRGLLLGAAVGAAYLGAIGGLLALSHQEDAGLDMIVAPRPIWETANVAAGATLEELLMRGFLLGQLLRHTRAVWAQLAVALIFASLHLPAWIVDHVEAVGVVASFAVVLVLGLVLGGITQWSRSLIPAIVLHTLNNLLQRAGG